MTHSRASLGCALSSAVAVLLLAGPPVWSQSTEPRVIARLDSTTATIGDVRELSLLLHFDQGWTPLLPVAPPELAVDGVVSAVEDQSGQAVAGSEAQLSLRWGLSFFELGEHHLDAIPVSFVTESGDTAVVHSNSLDITILSVREEGETGLRDIEPPFAIPGGVPVWLLAILGTLVIVGVAVLVRWFILRQRSDAPHVKPIQRVDYVREFARIEEMGLVERNALKLHYSLLSETLRRFLQDRIGIPAPDLTTREIHAELCNTMNGGPLEVIEEFLTAADMVKFAKATPPKEDSLRAPGAGKRIVREVESLLQPGPEDLAATLSVAHQPTPG